MIQYCPREQVLLVLEKQRSIITNSPGILRQSEDSILHARSPFFLGGRGISGRHDFSAGR